MALNQSSISSEKFKTMLGQLGNDTQQSDKIKIAFAEGEQALNLTYLTLYNVPTFNDKVV